MCNSVAVKSNLGARLRHLVTGIVLHLFRCMILGIMVILQRESKAFRRRKSQRDANLESGLLAD